MKKTINTSLLFILSFISQIGFSQEYLEEFYKYLDTNDTINQVKILEKWKSEEPNDPELFTSYFNYHFNKSRKEVLALTNDQPNDDSLIIKDSLNQNVGFIGSQVVFDEKELQKGLDKIDEGIQRYPNRLDMRFGKIYALGQIYKWNDFASEIIQTVKYSTKNNNNWTWTKNKKYEGGQKEFLLSIQSYQLQLYNTGDDALLKHVQDIANTILNYYPNHIESLSNLSITYLVAKEYDKAIAVLLRAEKITPDDPVILGNLAHGYKLKGNKKKAIEYYKKLAKHDKEDVKAFAKKQITELNQ
ncbi:Tetratricopeptide repeat protein [Tenacibaculum sp. 190130A14a]|uniref:Tetratricopeptide repeat protein n=1 Tax=Tenacibaculum polynesiense TaxID=3137857 RepID=A0ABM9P726_9FLAO